MHFPNVPVYPEIGDYVYLQLCVIGEDDDLWRALLTEVNNHTFLCETFHF